MANIQRIDSPDLFPPTGYSHVVRHGNTAYIAGAAGLDADGNFSDDPEEQIRRPSRTCEPRSPRSAPISRPWSNGRSTSRTPSTSARGATCAGQYIGDDIRPAGALLIIDALALPGLIVEIEAIAALDG